MNFELLRRKLRSLNWPARPRDPRKTLGRRGERRAARFLKRRGYRVLARNYHCPFGEIDLAASHRETIVFVEVKTRTVDDAEAEIAIRSGQRESLERTAACFLREFGAEQRPHRFDVVTVSWPARGAPFIEHFEDAFHRSHSQK